MSKCQQLFVTGIACDSCIEKQHTALRIMSRTVEWHEDDVDHDIEGLCEWHDDMLLDAGDEWAAVTRIKVA